MTTSEGPLTDSLGPSVPVGNPSGPQMAWQQPIGFAPTLWRPTPRASMGGARAVTIQLSPYLHVGHRTWSSFKVCGYTGLGLAMLLSLTLTLHRGASPIPMLVVILAAILTFFALALATKIVTGEEQLTYYHHEIAVLMVAALLLGLLHQPVLLYLDPTVLGVGIFLACGRIGCLMAGCCHGRPCSVGVRYTEQHAIAGFPSHYVGIRLFPIQVIESLWVFCTVVIGAALVWHDYAPGVALAWYVVVYDVGRFVFEFVRGDEARPYHVGLSEAQWISVTLTWLVTVAGTLGIVDFQLWQLGATLSLTGIFAIAALAHSRQDAVERHVLDPRHVREVAHALEQVRSTSGEAGSRAQVVCTSLGVQISAGSLQGLQHYTISVQGSVITDKTAHRLGNLITLLHHAGRPYESIRGRGNVVHLLVRQI